MTVFDSIERSTALDSPAAAARAVVGRVLTNQVVKDALHGVWLGHPLHPALAQLSLGSLLSATIIDLAGGEPRESTRLMAVGAAAAVPTAMSGWADYGDAHEEQQRLGIVHAALNAAAVAGYATALVLRGRGHRARGLSLVAGALAGAAAALGGHMSYKQALGANHTEHVPHIGPGSWQPLGQTTEFVDGEPVRRQAGDVAVLVVRRADDLHVLSDTCPHLAAPMHDGEIVHGADGRDTVVCPWHASAFHVDDGTVVHGPATAALPCFDTRVVEGMLEAKVREIPGVPAG